MSETQTVTNKCIEVKIPGTDLSFRVCEDTVGLKLIHNNKEITVSIDDFRNAYALRALLALEFNYDLKSELTGKIAGFLQLNEEVNKLINQTTQNSETKEYKICLKLVNNICNGEYILANKQGVFLLNQIYVKSLNNFQDELKLISSVKIKEINEIKFNGIIDVDFNERFVKITTDENKVITGSVDEVTTFIKSKYGLKKS
ncbi:hypothetical protein [Saccharolobus islandicus]|uniref:hypothetical protein n=1 Tax=Saccharolobus islandicus TaxID=43080 RepID=UPI0003711926|nr:hypothetical protein [Sulfolobus islandicus]